MEETGSEGVGEQALQTAPFTGVNTTVYKARIARKEKVKLIKEKLEAERKKTEELQIYEILAAANPEIRKLLNELKEIQ